ncbi:MAG: protein kinase domain-containing protein [Nitrososphaeraceae archaeon]
MFAGLTPAKVGYVVFNSPRIKITDWGLGKDINRQSLALTTRTTDGQIGGTPGYCSPEQWFAFDEVDGRTDIFSLGIIFYEMMTRMRPPSYDDNMNRPAIEPPSKYHHTISRKLDYCILKMVDLKPENRQQSIWDLIFELETLPDNY